jgi:hypothetical protein
LVVSNGKNKNNIVVRSRSVSAGQTSCSQLIKIEIFVKAPPSPHSPTLLIMTEKPTNYPAIIRAAQGSAAKPPDWLAVSQHVYSADIKL